MNYLILTSISLSNAYTRYVYRQEISMGLPPTFRNSPTLKLRVPLPDWVNPSPYPKPSRGKHY